MTRTAEATIQAYDELVVRLCAIAAALADHVDDDDARRDALAQIKAARDSFDAAVPG
jgi:hypothetical protein